MKLNYTRRQFFRGARGLVIAGGLATSSPASERPEKNREPSNAVSPTEDLMREHGVLDRVLLVYEAALGKFAGGIDFDVGVLSRAANIVRDFIEGYHERNEEQALFPRFRKAGELTNLVDVLYQQHQAGRRLTDGILMLAPASAAAGEERRRLIGNLQAFVAMYRPHEAREDTELFPRLRAIVSAHELDAMAEDFERIEHRKFGDDGFAMMVARIADIERALDIYDLARATPHD
jgi:hemerythrin-like domain-containing protein